MIDEFDLFVSLVSVADADATAAFVDEFERYLAMLAAERIDNPTYWPDEDCEDIDYDWD